MPEHSIGFSEILEIVQDSYNVKLEWVAIKEKIRLHIINKFNINNNIKNTRDIDDVVVKSFVKIFKSKYAKVVQVKKGFDYFKTTYATWLDKNLTILINNDDSLVENDVEAGRFFYQNKLLLHIKFYKGPRTDNMDFGFLRN